MAYSTADGSVVIDVNMDVSKAEKQLGKLTNDIEKREKEIQDLTQKRDAAKEKSVFDAAKLDAEKAKLQEIKDRLQDIRNMSKDKSFSLEQRESYKAQIPALQQEVSEQQKRVNMLQSEWNKLENSVDRYGQKIEEANQKLADQKAAAGVLTQEIEAARKAQSGMSGAISDASAYLDRFTDRIKKLASRVFVFTLISSALRNMRTWMGKVIKTNSEARQSIAQLKGALLTLAQPLVEVIIPAFITLVNVLTRIITAVAQLVSLLFGKTLKQSKDGAKALYNEANAIEGVGAAAKEAAGSLAGFDEINTITTENAGGGVGAAEDIAPDFSMIDDGLADRLKEIADLVGLIAAGLALWKLSDMLPGILGTIAKKLAGILLTVGGLLLLWRGLTDAWENGVDWLNLIEMIGGLAAAALGLYLLFGPIAAGIALIVGGLAMLVTGIKDVIDNGWNLQNMLLIIGGLIAGGLGISLLIGSWIPLLIASIAGIAVAIVANWGEVEEFLQGSVGFVTGLLSGALLVLGAILLFSGANIPLGLGLMAAGAIGLAASIAANWDTVQQALEGPVGTITALVSSALLALGAILLFSGAAIPLGIGLMTVGAVGLATSIAANWNTVQNALGGPISAVTAIASAALLVLGIILLFTGAAVPLGLGLMAVGAVGLAATIAPNWNFVLDAIKGAWANIKTWWGANAKKFFTLDYWKDLGKNMIKGLLDGLSGIFSGLKSWASNVWSTITGVFSKNNAKASITGATSGALAGASGTFGRSGIQMSSVPYIAEAQIPRLAQGAVIPPNREFMAVLGDQRSGNNLEGPESLFRQIVREESGGGNAELVQLLQSILNAIKDGHIIMVDGTTFGRTAIRTINTVTASAGKTLLHV